MSESGDTLPPSDPPDYLQADTSSDVGYHDAFTSEDIPLKKIIKGRFYLESDDGPLEPWQAPETSDDTPLQYALSQRRGINNPGHFDTPLGAPNRGYGRPRSSSLPVEATHATSDVLYSPATERRVRNAAANKKRIETLARNRAHNREVEKLTYESIREARVMDFEEVLELLKEKGISLAEFLDYVFNPTNDLNDDWRWLGFFKHQTLVLRILGYWTTSSYSATVRNLVEGWVTGQARKIAGEEARAISREGILSKTNKVINEDFFLSYSISGLTSTLRSLAPVFFSLLDAFSITSRQKSNLSEKWAEKKRIMEGSAVLTLLKSRSQTNSYAQAVHGTYLMATGAQRQHFSVLASLGITVGYGNIIDQRKPGKATVTTKKPRTRTPGTLFQLSQACRETARRIASSGLYVTVYDNINMMIRVAEQIVGRKNAQENGTCATVLPLHNARLEDLRTQTLDERITNAGPLRLEDLELTEPESILMNDVLVHTILSIIVTHGGEGFAKWSDDLKNSQPHSSDTIDVHQTPIHPLPAMEIDESTITGNVEIIEAIVAELHPNCENEGLPEYIKIIAGDQLTIAWQRSILNIQVGHEDGADSWKHIVLMPGLFHAKIADCHGLLTTHFGKSSTRSPGSLAFHNTCLDRLPIVLTSLPSFRVCRDLIMVSLYARVLYLLLQVSNTNTIEEYLKQYTSWTDLQEHAKKILERYTDADRVQELRQPREKAEHQRLAKLKAEQEATKSVGAAARALARKGPSVSPLVPTAGKSTPAPEPSVTPIQYSLKEEDQGDMVFENAVLFLRDALLTRLFADAVKAGDSGLVILVLKLWTFAYRGSGRSKYAHEMLHLFHNLMNVWSKGLRTVITQNWLLNPTGKPNAFVEIDLVQEHLNFWVKKIYKADGDAHSWDWLALVSPCIDVLRRLSMKLNVELGSRQGSKHSVPDLQKDINALMDVLKEHEVYNVKLGRGLDVNDSPVPDIISAGLSALCHGTTTTNNPLAEFNAQYNCLRERRNLKPVSALVDNMNDQPLHPETLEHSPYLAHSHIFGSECTNEGQPEEDTNESDAVLEDNNQLSDLYELEVESPTLMRLEEDDVALDMDELDLEDEDGLDTESDDDDDDDI